MEGTIFLFRFHFVNDIDRKFELMKIHGLLVIRNTYIYIRKNLLEFDSCQGVKNVWHL